MTRPIRRRAPFPPLAPTRARMLFADESGAATAEYAIATMAAVAFAGMLVVIMRRQLTRNAGQAGSPIRAA